MASNIKEAETGLAGDSHTSKMAALTDPKSLTFHHTSLHAVRFNQTNELKTLIQNNPKTKAILYSFGANDIDPSYQTLEHNYSDIIIKDFMSLARDTRDSTHRRTKSKKY